VINVSKGFSLISSKLELHGIGKKISIIVPAFNEAPCLEKNIMAIREAIQRITRSYEIILAEDGSTDGTDIVSKKLAVENPWIIHSHFAERLGKGGALKRAFRVSSGELIIFMDADIATSLNCLPQMIGEIERGYDMAIGSRRIRGSKSKRSPSRTLLSWIYNLFVRILFGTGVYDHQCGFKAFRRNMVESVIDDVQSNSFIFDTEFIVIAKNLGFSIKEFPVIWAEPESRLSKVQLLRDGFRMGLQLLKLRANIWKH